jgi:hypothetical protein
MILERDYLQAALDEAARLEQEHHEERVSARFHEWWDATMRDEIARSGETGKARSARWWGRRFQELMSMARREVARGVAL